MCSLHLIFSSDLVKFYLVNPYHWKDLVEFYLLVLKRFLRLNLFWRVIRFSRSYLIKSFGRLRYHEVNQLLFRTDVIEIHPPNHISNKREGGNLDV